MNRQEFMKRLEELLSGISPEEREEALAYYRNYFEDAGVENEEKVLRELESPEKLAESIRAGLQEDGVYAQPVVLEKSEYEQDQNTQKQNMQNQSAQNQNERRQNAYNQGMSRTAQPAGGNQGTDDNTALIVVLVVVAVVTSPIWLGLLSGIFGMLVGAFCALLGITIGFLVGGIACVGVGISYFCVADISLGFLSLGCGSLLIAAGLLALLLLVQFCGRFLPWVIRGIVHLFRSIFHSNRKEQRV
jgi:hypothetical protein